MYYRKKHGKGFTYQDQQKQTIRDKNLVTWFKSLVIPPAWTEVEIAKSKRAKILVTGRDEKRKKTVYLSS